MRRAARKDENAEEVADALRAAGCRVQVMNQSGLPDLLVGVPRWAANPLFIFCEVKRLKSGALTPAQVKFHDAWRGFPVFVVHSAEEALRIVETLKGAT